MNSPRELTPTAAQFIDKGFFRASFCLSKDAAVVKEDDYMNLVRKLDGFEQELRPTKAETFVLSYAENENLDDPDMIPASVMTPKELSRKH